MFRCDLAAPMLHDIARQDFLGRLRCQTTLHLQNVHASALLSSPKHHMAFSIHDFDTSSVHDLPK